MVRSQLLGQAGGFFCRQSSHRPQVRELWEVGRDIIQRRHSVSPPGRNFLSVYHKKSRCNTRSSADHGDGRRADLKSWYEGYYALVRGASFRYVWDIWQAEKRGVYHL